MHCPSPCFFLIKDAYVTSRPSNFSLPSSSPPFPFSLYLPPFLRPFSVTLPSPSSASSTSSSSSPHFLLLFPLFHFALLFFLMILLYPPPTRALPPSPSPPPFPIPLLSPIPPLSPFSYYFSSSFSVPPTVPPVSSFFSSSPFPNRIFHSPSYSFIFVIDFLPFLSSSLSGSRHSSGRFSLGACACFFPPELACFPFIFKSLFYLSVSSALTFAKLARKGKGW